MLACGLAWPVPLSELQAPSRSLTLPGPVLFPQHSARLPCAEPWGTPPSAHQPPPPEEGVFRNQESGVSDYSRVPCAGQTGLVPPDCAFSCLFSAEPHTCRSGLIDSASSLSNPPECFAQPLPAPRVSAGGCELLAGRERRTQRCPSE